MVKKDESAWDVFKHVKLTKEPRNFAERVLIRITDYEIIWQQAMELMHLRRHRDD